MRDVRAALQARLLADTRVATLVAGSTTSTLKLGTGQGAAWSARDVFNITGAGLEAENSLACAQVRVVSGDDLELTASTTLPVAPSAGVTVRGGAREWMRYISASEPGLYYFKRLSDAPVAELFATDADSRVVIVHGDPIDTPELGTLVRTEWILVAMGRDPAWIEGLSQRILLLFHAQKAAIAVDGRDVQEIAVRTSELGERGDGLFERVITIEVLTSDVLDGTYLVPVANARNAAHGDLVTVITTGLAATAIVERTSFNVEDFGRHFDRDKWPRPGRALVVCIEGDGTAVREERQSERLNVKSRVTVRAWVYDRRSYVSLCVTLNDLLYRLGEAMKLVNANDSWARLGYRFEFTDFGLLQVPSPYAGAGVTAVAGYRV